MDTIEEIELYAHDHYIPIARKQTVKFMVDLIKQHNYKSFLEIGTAIGYTSIVLAKTFKDINIFTIEHDIKRAEIAKTNFEHFNVKNNITMVVDDAVTYNVEGTYDLIFIDAAKKRNMFFLEKFEQNLSKGGIIIVDNMNLDDFWVNAKKEKKEQYDRVNQEFKDAVLSSPKYDAKLYEDIGDGIMVIKIKR